MRPEGAVAGRRHIHLDVLGGVAGDMFVAAMLDALPELRERVLADVAAVLPAACGRAVLVEGESGGVRTLRLTLAPAGAGGVAAAPAHAAYGDLLSLVAGAALHDGTAEEASALLTRLADVEARIHGVARENVHFHELADWDSLMDVVAAGSIAAALAGTQWSVSDLPLGGGRAKTAHGLLPVPAPATVELLRGFAWRDDGIGGERVTPTGAAILRHLVASAGAHPPPGARLDACGTGAGTRELPGMPNVLRAFVFDVQDATSDERIVVLSFEIDDMTGEEIGVAADRLRGEAGVLDVSLGARLGKKGRPMTSFRLLVDPACTDAVARRCLTETTTLGVRWRVEQRRVLARQTTTSRAADGTTVRVKHVVRPSGETTAKAESDDVQDASGLAQRRARKAQAEGDWP